MKWLSISLTIALAVILVFDPLSHVHAAVLDGRGGDKWRHILTFGLLVLPTAVFWLRALPGMALFLMLCGGLIELTQPLFGRERDLLDMLANAVGLIGELMAGLSVGLIVSRR